MLVSVKDMDPKFWRLRRKNIIFSSFRAASRPKFSAAARPKTMTPYPWSTRPLISDPPLILRSAKSKGGLILRGSHTNISTSRMRVRMRGRLGRMRDKVRGRMRGRMRVGLRVGAVQPNPQPNHSPTRSPKPLIGLRVGLRVLGVYFICHLGLVSRAVAKVHW